MFKITMTERYFDKRFDEMFENEFPDALSMDWATNSRRACKKRYAVVVGNRNAAGKMPEGRL